MRRLRTIIAIAALLATSAAAAPAGRSTWYRTALFEGETDSRQDRLEAGYSYTYYGTCDLGCSDLDFALYRWVPATAYRRGYWKFIAADRRPDDEPAITVTPSYDATYRLDVIMSRCNSEPCNYEVNIF